MSPALWALVGVAGVLLAIWVTLVAVLWWRGRRGDARAIAGFVPDCIRLCARLCRDGRVPRRERLLVAGLLAYLSLPFDVIPDVVPVAGQLDDVLIAGFVLRRLVRVAGREIVDEHWPGPASSRELLLRLAGAA